MIKLRHLVTIQILEDEGCEIVKDVFIKDIERTGQIKVIKFHRMEIISTRKIGETKEPPE